MEIFVILGFLAIIAIGKSLEENRGIRKRKRDDEVASMVEEIIDQRLSEEEEDIEVTDHSENDEISNTIPKYEKYQEQQQLDLTHEQVEIDFDTEKAKRD